MRCIMMSEETAELFDCKKTLDELYSKVGAIAARMFGDNSEYGKQIGENYAKANQIICNLLAENIDITSTDSNYKVI